MKKWLLCQQNKLRGAVSFKFSGLVCKSNTPLKDGKTTKLKHVTAEGEEFVPQCRSSSYSGYSASDVTQEQILCKER